MHVQWGLTLFAALKLFGQMQPPGPVALPSIMRASVSCNSPPPVLFLEPTMDAANLFDLPSTLGDGLFGGNFDCKGLNSWP